MAEKIPEEAQLEDELVGVIEPILEKYKESLHKGIFSKANIDFRNFAAHDIAKVATPIIEKRTREKIADNIDEILNRIFNETASPKVEFGESQWRLFAERMYRLQNDFARFGQALKEKK